MRRIDNIVVHCSATPHSTSVDSIRRYWREVLGWKNPGYHCIIKANGDAIELLSADKVANGVGGHNSNSMHVCYIGGQFIDDRTTEQKQALLLVLTAWKQIWPQARILGHRDFPNVAKACPQFDAITEYSHL